MMVGAYIFYLWTVEMEMNLAVSSVGTVLFMVVLGAVCLKIFVLPFTRYSFLLCFVTTLALSTMLESGISMIFGVNVKSLSAGSDVSSMEFWGVFITPIQILIIVSALTILFVAAYVIHFTAVGRKIRALSEHKYAAESLGVNSQLVNYTVFLISVCMAAYAGILVGYETNMQPTMGGAYTIKAFASMVLGGLGNIWGTVVGSYVLGLIENLGIGLDFGGYSLPAGYKDAFAFVIILVMLLFRPMGLFKKAGRRI